MEKRRLLVFKKPRTGELLSFKTNQYYVSDDGMVWDDDRKRYVAQRENRGYLAVNLRDDEGKWQTSIGVHRLIASVFLRLLEQGEEVHHIDKNPKNNNISNLKILTASEHQRQHNIENWAAGRMEGVAAQASERAKRAWAAGAHECHGNKVAAKLRNVGTSRPAKQVAQLDIDGRLVEVWPSTKECQRNGFYSGHVADCCNGKRKSHKGFRWMWMEDYLAKQPTVASQPVHLELNDAKGDTKSDTIENSKLINY